MLDYSLGARVHVESSNTGWVFEYRLGARIKIGCYNSDRVLEYRLGARVQIEPKILGVGPKLSLQWALKVTNFTFLRRGTTPF